MAGSFLYLTVLAGLVAAASAELYQCGASWEAMGVVRGSRDRISPAQCQKQCDNDKGCWFFSIKEEITDPAKTACNWYGKAFGVGTRKRSVIMVCAKVWAWPKLNVPSDFVTNKGYVAPLAPGVTGEYRMVAYSTGGIAIHATMVPNTSLILTYGRPQDPSIAPQPGMSISYAPNVEWPSSLIDTATGKYVAVKSDIGGPFCAHTVHLANGDILSCGGDDSFIGKPGNGNWGGARGCRYFTLKGGARWIPRKNLVGRHWYPTMLELPPGTAGARETCTLIMGGFVGGDANAAPTTHVEVMCPLANSVVSTPVLKSSGDEDVHRALLIKYPISYVLPIGAPPAAPQILLLHDVGGTVQQVNLDYRKKALSFKTLKTLPRITEADLTFAIPSGAVMLAIDLAKPIVPEFVVFGGAHWRGNPYGAATSWRIKPLDAKPQWVKETMPSAAVLRPAVVLPNGKIALANGARKGNSGGGATCCYSAASEPIQQVWIYNPYAPVGKRYWVDPMIAPHIRLYHNEAMVGVDGSLLLLAGDQDVKPNNRPGFTIEAWTPPSIRLAIAQKTRPTIHWAPKSAKYGEVIGVNFHGAVSRCSLVKPAAYTHSLHANERVLILQTISTPKVGLLKVKMPSSSYVAVPGWWMLFCFKGDVWTTAHWMRLEL